MSSAPQSTSSSLSAAMASVSISDDNRDDDESNDGGSNDGDNDAENDEAQDDEDDDDAEADDNSDEAQELRLSKMEQLWKEYEDSGDRGEIRSRLLRLALQGAMPKKYQHKAHWMDLELITYAIRTAHGNTVQFTRLYLTQLARALAKNNHRNTSAHQNIKKDRDVVKALKEATADAPFKAKPRQFTKLRYQLDWMYYNVDIVAAPIMRRLMQIMENVLIEDDDGEHTIKLLKYYFPRARDRSEFEKSFCSSSMVKKLEKITQREWNVIACKRNIKLLDQQRKASIAAAIAPINERFQADKLDMLHQHGFNDEEQLDY